MKKQNPNQGAPPFGGGGVAAFTSDTTSAFTLKFVNNTISDNQATGLGATGRGVLADSSAGGTIKIK